MEELQIRPSMLFMNENQKDACKLLDKNARTKWIGSQLPAYFDVRFETLCNVREILLQVGRNSTCVFSVFASEDGSHFSEIFSQENDTPQKGIYRFAVDCCCCALRFLIQYDSDSIYARVRNLAVFGEATTQKPALCEDPLPEAFQNSEFDRPITAQDTIDAVYGIVSRTIGDAFTDRFEFCLEESGEEFFSLCDAKDKIRISANSGVNLAAGLGWYYKYYCNLHFSQVGNNSAAPSPLPKIGTPLRRHTPFKVRYAYNYCALSYTMAFWGEEDWQKELDRLALQGVNLVLDITALEEVWRRFLCKLGYSVAQAQAFITGPAYYAWFNMANIYGTGGPVPRAFFCKRTALARRNHLFMRKLGMQPVLQGYSGMVPPDIKDYVPDASVIRQGLWNGLDRPAMLRTNTACYSRLAKLFYESQKEVFGTVSRYFATDPFHEGGKAGAMNLATVSRKIMESLLESEPNAVWILQSWGENPSRALLDGIADKKEHTLILDLYAEKKPRWESFLDREFMQTPWVYCMLNNFGGRMGLHGHLRTIATEVARAANTAQHMRGIGITPEATFSNPIIFDLFFETMWTENEQIEPIDLEKWLRGYAVRRYGSCPDSIFQALQLLNQTVYNPDLNEHGEGAPESVINARPTLHPTSPSSWGNDVVAYPKEEFEQAVRCFTQDLDLFKHSEGYRFDLIDFLKQILSNTAQEYQHNMAAAYHQRDAIAFRRWADRFMRLIQYTDEILAGEKTFMLGTWLGKAAALAEGFDAFSKKMFQFNARALITTWTGSRQGADPGGLRDYSNKQWAGLTADFYGRRWQLWIKNRIDELDGKLVFEPDWFRLENRWTWAQNPYSDIPVDLDLAAAAEKVLNCFGVETAKES